MKANDYLLIQYKINIQSNYYRHASLMYDGADQLSIIITILHAGYKSHARIQNKSSS